MLRCAVGGPLWTVVVAGSLALLPGCGDGDVDVRIEIDGTPYDFGKVEFGQGLEEGSERSAVVPLRSDMVTFRVRWRKNGRETYDQSGADVAELYVVGQADRLATFGEEEPRPLPIPAAATRLRVVLVRDDKPFAAVFLDLDRSS